ncbi:class I SAM-dependent methyltransferase [Arcicella sp. LKC2W]|uniref:class I SAM-dependent methyltransferase n=1 Tax=Arcicella sp. LKC2W TaxID=2984198 RepID=UPI002B1E9199|nr:class I SAM-dependent methyltransferase [Arcicella sp. LKC2W]MEA5458969.1 class I SAM-dependent methyltransferase [Arcicella sp. LKC2W]
MDNIVFYKEKDSLYFQNNPTWHVEDSPWKATQILKILKRNNIDRKKIAEVGCGVGEILNQLHLQLNSQCKFYGYEISPDAFSIAQTRTKERLSFYEKDIFEEKLFFDILLVIDIFEHVENYIDFIRKTKDVAEYKIFHIPLDMNVSNILRGTPITIVRNKVGHLHYFSKDTALATLNDCGHEVIDFFYTPGMMETEGKSLKTKLLNPIRRVLFFINPNFAVRLLGGYSLMVLTK